jgi:DNA-binding NtrC family response regulator
LELQHGVSKISTSTEFRAFTDDGFSLEEMEKHHIINMLKRYNGNKSKTARVLNISRSTLREKMKNYGIA